MARDVPLFVLIETDEGFKMLKNIGYIFTDFK